MDTFKSNMLQLALEWKQKLEYILELDLETILMIMDIIGMVFD